MAAAKSILSTIRKQGGNILKLIGLGTIGSKVSNASSGFSDAMTFGIIVAVVLLFTGGKR